MTSAFDIDLATRTLVQAWRSGEQITALPAAASPRMLSEGYDIQDRFVAAIDPGVAGWKLGVGSHKAKVASGIGRSIAGRVLRSGLFESGDVIRLPNPAPVTVEIEIGFVLGRDVHPGEAPGDPLALVAEARLTAELVLSRFHDRRSVGWASFAADNAAFQALVVGPPIPFDERDKLDRLRRSLVVDVNGQERARAAVGEDMTDPVQALADLLEHARERGITLRRSDIVTTGSQSAPFTVEGTAFVVGRCEFASLAFSTALMREASR